MPVAKISNCSMGISGRIDSAIRFSELSVHQPPNAPAVPVAQFGGQGGVGKTLKANWPCEPFDCTGADGSEMRIRRRRIRPAMMHRRADLDAGREVVEDQAPDLLLQQAHEALVTSKIRLGPVEACRELARQVARHLFKLPGRSAAHQKCGWAKDFF